MKDLPSRLARLGITIEQAQDWPQKELNTLYQAVTILANIMGGRDAFIQRIHGVTIQRTGTGQHLGLAYRERIKLSANSPISTWTVLHELAHVWDAKNNWQLSLWLEKFTHGFTCKPLSFIKRFIPGQWDAGKAGPLNRPGFYGRKPGCNAAGYFYGDKPSGSNWNFNRKEDFAESVVMYLGWGRENEISRTAHGRIERYLLPNGKKDRIYGIADNWSDYAKFFLPENADYSKTRRWQFIHDLIQPD
jgi:hypothetical protein